MIKKVILSVFVLAASVYSTALASSSNSTDDFNPEHSEFSRLTTLKTWVASRHLAAPSETKSLQRNIAMTVPENRFSINFVRQVANNLEDKRFFGKTFFTIKDGELPFLQFVHEISKVKAPVVLEIAAARGYVTWKIPYCFETTGTVYANDLSSTMLNSDFQTMVENRLPPPLRNMLHKIPGDCFEIPNKYPDLVGKIDAIYVQNLEHFFNPIQHQDFLRLLSILLTQNGRAFLISHTLDPQVAIPSNPVFSLYKEHKEKEIYPGFMKVTCSSYSLKSGISIGSLDVAEATRPEQSTSCSTTTISCQDAEITFNGKKEMGKFLTQVVISNFYTPTIYKNAISTHKSLTMVATYFMDRHGNKHEKFGDSTSMAFAAAILEKNSH